MSTPATSARRFSERARTWWRWLGGRRHPLIVVFGSVAVALGVGVGLAAIAGNDEVWERMHSFHPQWLAVCLVAQAIAYVGYVFALREAAHVDDGPRLSFRFAARVVAAGFGAFFSASAAGGFEVDYWALRHAGNTRREAVARVLGLGTLEYAVLAPAAMFSAVALLAGPEKVRPGLTWPWLAVMPGFFVAAWATSPGRSARWSGGDDRGWLGRILAHAVSGLTVLRRLVVQPRAHGMAFVGASLYWFGEILCLWASLRAFGAAVEVPKLILAYATGYVLTRRSLPAGGVGISEVALTFALYWLGVPFAPALLGVFSYRIFNFWLALVPALAVLPTVRRIRDAMPHTEREFSAERL